MGALTPFAADIWLAEGDEVSTAGFRYPTCMAVVRLSDGGLFVWSPVALTDAIQAEVEALGDVRWLIAPNALHHLWLPEWKAAYPDARAFAAPGVRRKRPDVDFAGDLGDAPCAEWAGEIDQVLIAGNLIADEAAFFHRASRTAIFTDLLQQFPPGWHSGWRATVAKLDLMVAPEPSTPRKFRGAFLNRRKARAAVSRALDWPAERVIMAHGAPVERDGQAFLRRAFRWLVK